MFPLLCLTIVAFFTHTVHSWDVAVAVGKNIEFYRENGSRIEVIDQEFNELTSLTFDSVHKKLYFCDNTNEKNVIFSYNFDSKNIQPLVDKTFSENVQGIAYDPLLNVLFWTDGKKKSINWMKLTPGDDDDSNKGILRNFTNNENPKSIAFDSCRRYVYWSNINLNRPTIERLSISEKNQRNEIIVGNDLFTPICITIDQQSKKLFWIDDREGAHFKIECSNLNGGDRKAIYHGMNHQPYSIVVNKGMLYWSDWLYRSIWKMPLQLDSKSEAIPVSLKEFSIDTPNGIVARINLLDQIRKKSECKGLKNLILNVTNSRSQALTQDDGGFSSINSIYG